MMPQPAPAPFPAPAPQPGMGDIAVFLLGLLLTLGGLGVGVLALFASLDEMLSLTPGSTGELATSLFIGAEMALVLGVPLAVAGLSPFLSRRPRRFGMGPWWAWAAAWGLVLLAGQLVMMTAAPSRFVEATLHLAAMLLPVLALTAWMAPRLAARGITWRGAWLHLVSGATLSVAAAILLEIVGVVLLGGTIYLLALATTPDAPARLQELIDAFRSGTLLQEQATLARYLAWPPVSIFVVLTFSVLVPLIEEFIKPVSVLLRLIVRRGELEPGAAFLLGALCGAGFALVEGPLNTVTAIGGDLWVATAVLRFGATLLHAFNTGLFAWAWAELLERRRWRRWLLGMIGALVLHGVWNGSTVVLLFAGQENEEIVGAFAMLFYVFMSLLSGAGLVLGARRLRAAAPPAPETLTSSGVTSSQV